MMPFQFKELPRVFPQQRIWGCVACDHTFVITEENGRFSASTKYRGIGKRIDLGAGFEAFSSFDEAQQVCVDYIYPQDK